ncbi:MAG: polyprenyl synthetase family protein [Spirochaetaceae bacterium]|jgi:octaprenyl-diphosphate synthase|nr:polyprenyl synthetase family protein [Spirochaetaceae bacterium]
MPVQPKANTARAHCGEILQNIERILSAALENDGEESRYPLSAPVKALLQAGGKRWRPLLMALCAELGAGHEDGAPPSPEAAQKAEAACHLAPMVEFAHTASLIHDDIEDASDMRRGKPAAHITWGVDTALNAGSWLYFKALECVEDPRIDPALRPALYALYGRELRRLHLGQAMDIAWHRDPAFFPTRNDYLRMVTLKTGTLASLAAQAGLILGGRADKAADAGQAAAGIGAAFQLLDDAANLSTGNPGKKRGDDVVEGKKSFVIIRHLEERPQDAPLIAGCFARAKAEGIESPAVERLIALVTESGALSQGAAEARRMMEGACGAFESRFPGQKKLAKSVTNLFLPLP